MMFDTYPHAALLAVIIHTYDSLKVKTAFEKFGPTAAAAAAAF